MEPAEGSSPKPLPQVSSDLAQLQVWDDVTTEPYKTPDSLSYQNPIISEVPELEDCLCGDTSNPANLIIKNDQETGDLQSKSVQEEDFDAFFDCEDFRSFFTDIQDSSLFSDNPDPLEIDNQTRQTLPPDFGLGQSDILDAGEEMFKNINLFDEHLGSCEGDLLESMIDSYSCMLSGNTTMDTNTTPDLLTYLNPATEEQAEDRGDHCGGTSNPIGLINLHDQQPGVVQSEPTNEFLYCEVCKSYFTNMCMVHGPALFIYDTPVLMGIDERATHTLPPCLELRKSAAGLSVFNKGETIPLSAHFGPYEGDLVDREAAMNSAYSWVILKRGQCEQYIDAQRVMSSNWMRYVNCARNEKEQNLVAFQYQGGIFYRCCQPIAPGQELLMWYADDYGNDLGAQFDYLWKNKSCSNEMNNALLQTFFCPWCPLSYTSQIYFNNHLKRSHSNQYGEQLQPKEVTTFGTSTDSTHRQDNVEVYHCNCGMRFTNPDDCKTHQCIHTRENPNPCSRNEEDVPQESQSSLSREKTYNCLQCGKSFISRRNYQQHNRIHTGEKPYVCSQCGKCFRQQIHLRTHQRIHTGEKPYQCTHCGKSFNNGSNYRHHQRIHTGEKPYHCSVCGKSFTSQSHLTDHVRIHTGEKPYQCLHCEKVFNKSSSFNRHQHIHTGKKPYQCPKCGQSFMYSITCKRHKCSMTQPSGV